MRRFQILSTFLGAVLLALASSCSHPQNIERKDPLDDQVVGKLTPTDRVFLADDPASRVKCNADAQCPVNALCHSVRHVCFTASPLPQMTKIEVTCPLVPVYFPFDSAELVPEARDWVQRDAECLKVRGAKTVVLSGYADERGARAYNRELSQRRAEVVQKALADVGSPVQVVVEGKGENALIPGRTEHDYAYNRRVDLDVPKSRH